MLNEILWSPPPAFDVRGALTSIHKPTPGGIARVLITNAAPFWICAELAWGNIRFVSWKIRAGDPG